MVSLYGLEGLGFRVGLALFFSLGCPLCVTTFLCIAWVPKFDLRA